MSAHRTDRWQPLSLTSEALRGNPLGDPHERPLWVWSPADESRRYPAVYVIQGMLGRVDAFTAVGGSQFVDSAGTGRYHTYICDEIVPFVDEHFPTLSDARHRG